jgi:hypothetical protein
MGTPWVPPCTRHYVSVHALMAHAAERGMVLPVCYLDSPYIPRVTDLGRESTHPVIGSTMLEALDIWAHHDQRGGGDMRQSNGRRRRQRRLVRTQLMGLFAGTSRDN